MRFWTCLAVLLVAGVLSFTGIVGGGSVRNIGTPAATGAATAHPAKTAWDCGSNAISQGSFYVCAYIINPMGATNVPSNQSITPSSDNLGSAVSMSTAGLATIDISWHCSGAFPIGKVTFDILLYGFIMFTWIQSLPSACTATNLSGSTNFTDSNFSDYGLILSGVYSGSIVFYSANNTQLGSGVPFLIKIVSPYNPLTILVLLLMIVGLVEIFYLARDFLRIRKKLRVAREQRAALSRGFPPSQDPPGGR